ncbi:MAG TPA: hypothetical protein VEA41_08475 [Salinarimonas sp.]|nr:hypothetical protein [Salinarimonas sp.]
MSHQAELQRVLEEADLATGLAAQRYLPRFARKLARYRDLHAATRNPVLRRFYAWRATRYELLTAEAEGHIARARDLRGGHGLLPRR